jgi:sterol desaturase/sphingolipid hydroxylase (fatty acid hydroxylase superfamily)
MDALSDAIAFALHKAAAIWLSTQTVGTCTTLIVICAIAFGVKRMNGGTWREIAGPAIATDTAWFVFYISGVYTLLIGAPAYRLMSIAVQRFAPWLQIRLLAAVHPVVEFVVLWLALDLVAYGWHRLAHGSDVLWQFHKIHHSQKTLTPMTNYRFHFVDIALRTTLQTIPALILGSTTTMWVATVWMQIALDALAHSDLPWSYGIAGRFVTSPSFHRLHHSTELRDFGSNFGISFSIWDHLFGTARASDARPASYGLGTDEIPQSFVRQMFAPFVLVARRVFGRRTAAAVPRPVA